MDKAVNDILAGEEGEFVKKTEKKHFFSFSKNKDAFTGEVGKNLNTFSVDPADLPEDVKARLIKGEILDP